MQYRIEGTPLPVVICDLQAGETLITESGGMSWMTSNMQMETKGGSIGKALGRMFSGESLFLNHYTAMGGPGQISFSSSMPGNIVPFQITPQTPIVLQKRAFLAAESGVELSVFFQKKLGGGLFGGEGFIMQKLAGNGTAFAEMDGHIVQYQLADGQSLLVNTGYLAAMDATVKMEVEMVKGAKNILFGGEGLFNTKVTGPGRIWLQSMPASALAGSLMPYLNLTKSS